VDQVGLSLILEDFFMIIRKLGIYLLSLGLLAGCGSSSSSDEPVEAPGGLQVGPSEVVGSLMLALGSIDSESVGVQGASLRLLNNDDQQSSLDPLCSEKGAPYSETDGILRNGDDGYLIGWAYCFSAFNSVSPDTVQGALYLSRGGSCVAGEQDLFDDLEPGASNEGELVDVFASIQDLSNDCWGTEAERQAFIDNMSDEGSNLLDEGGMNIRPVVTRLSEDDLFDYEILLFMSEDGEEQEFFKLDIKSESGFMAARGEELEEGRNMAWVVSLDQAAGKIRYVANGEQEGDGGRISRLLVSGDISADGTIDSVDHLSAISMTFGPSSVSHFSSINGNGIVGYHGGAYYREDDDFITEEPECMGGDETCSGFEEIAFSGSELETLASSVGDTVDQVKNMTSFFTFDVVSIDVEVE